MSKAEIKGTNTESLCTKMNMTRKLTSPYEEMMRKFSEAHKHKCSSVVVDEPKKERPEKQFVTGSKYKGTWDVLGMGGTSAVYTFPNGVIYEGEFEDGLRHGNGEMRYPTGEIIKGKFRQGRMVERTLIFADGLEYSDTEWMYCESPDRRYTIEYEKGVMPAGMSFITADQPTREIPPGFYDTEDGLYDPKTKAVYKFDNLSAIKRSPNVREHKWISENCRTAPIDQIGPRRDLYENWLEPDTELAETPLPAAVSTATAWMFEPNRAMSPYHSVDSGKGSCDDFVNWLRRIRRSSVEKAPILEKLKSRATDTQPRSLSFAGTLTTPENRPRMQSVFEKSTTLGNTHSSPALRSSVVEKSTTLLNPVRSPILKSRASDGQLRSQSFTGTFPIPENRPRMQSVFEKSTTLNNPVRSREFSVVEKSTILDNPVRSRVSSVVEKSTTSEHAVKSRSPVSEKSSTSENLVRFRPTRKPT